MQDPLKKHPALIGKVCGLCSTSNDDHFIWKRYRTIEPNPLELTALPVKDLEALKYEKVGDISDLSTYVPRTGFEPAHPCERCDLNTVRLPISPSGQLIFVFQGCKDRNTFYSTKYFLKPLPEINLLTYW